MTWPGPGTGTGPARSGWSTDTGRDARTGLAGSGVRRPEPRSGARVVEEAALEMPYTGNRIEGSNPLRSAQVVNRPLPIRQDHRGQQRHFPEM